LDEREKEAIERMTGRKERRKIGDRSRNRTQKRGYEPGLLEVWDSNIR
jgi:hypothetical protein